MTGQLDYSNEDTMELTGEYMQTLITKPPRLPKKRFTATVPPHISEASIAHWDVETW